MINTIVVEEMIMQLDQNKSFRLVMRNRSRLETCAIKRSHFLSEMRLAQDCIRELESMLILEYCEGITDKQLYIDIKN